MLEHEIEEIEDSLDDWDLFEEDDFEDEDCDSENCDDCESYDDCPNGIHFDWDDDDC